VVRELAVGRQSEAEDGIAVAAEHAERAGEVVAIGVVGIVVEDVAEGTAEDREDTVVGVETVESRVVGPDGQRRSRCYEDS
jgi:hypothetical protein